MKSPRTFFLVFVLVSCGTGFLIAQHERKEDTDSGKQQSAKQQSESKSPKDDSAQEPAKVIRTEKEWRKILSPEQYRVLRKKGTERAFRNKYDKHFKPGVYACAACGQELFTSDTKFNSGCGWPAFYASLAGDRVKMTPDFSNAMARTEVTCARCGSHLGHIFQDAPQTPTGKRFCINSVSLKFIPAKSKKKDTKKKRG